MPFYDCEYDSANVARDQRNNNVGSRITSMHYKIALSRNKRYLSNRDDFSLNYRMQRKEKRPQSTRKEAIIFMFDLKGLRKQRARNFAYKSSYRFKRLGSKIAIIAILSATVFATVRGTYNVVCICIMYLGYAIRHARARILCMCAAVSRHATDVWRVYIREIATVDLHKDASVNAGDTRYTRTRTRV